ncbi:hypothetical protein [Neolewinella xylanilytica]|uniref:hypothetical protein n=1 Tax=Neolewinella xylanilytica TaxID=1514080 RepID=UPI000CEA882C|nr:hypothetical protein [Neolewinella xylanilytica]
MIKPTPTALYLNDTVVIPWSSTNLGEGGFRLREREDFFWQVEMTGYDASTATLFLRVTNFEAEAEDYQPDRTARAAVRALHFAPLDRAAFCSQLSYYETGRLPLTALPAVDGEETTVADSAGCVPEVRKVRSLHFTVAFEALRIGDGYVAGTYVSGELPPLPFRIPNPHLVKEFNAIRSYFARQLRRSTLEVSAELHFDGAGEPGIRRARSGQVDRIDDRMIEVLRARTLRQFLQQDDPDQSLFTPEELWERSADDDPVRTLLPPPGPELLEHILNEGSVRNARQLTHLATRHERGQKLRFVLTPQFGFFFFVRGEGMHHFILELLDSHATYIWSLPRGSDTLSDHFARVKGEVEQLNATGRQAYRRTNTFDHTFWSVRHEQIDSPFVDGFSRWRARLEEGLV